MQHYAYIALIFALLGFVKWYSATQYDSGLNACKAAYAVKLEEAVASTRATEKSRYTLVSQATQDQFDEVSTINNNLLNDIAELRDRPTRAERDPVSGDTTAACNGATGREFSRGSSEDIVKLASRADKLRASDKACRSAYSSLTN